MAIAINEILFTGMLFFLMISFSGTINFFATAVFLEVILLAVAIFFFISAPLFTGNPSTMNEKS